MVSNTLNDLGKPGLIPANPGFVGGGSDFSFAICNSSSTQSHALQSVGVKIASLVPDTSNNINVEGGCDASFSSKARQYPVGGCGGRIAGSVEAFMATWPAAVSAGTTAIDIKQIDNEQSNPPPGSINPYGNLPIALKPGKTINLFVGMKYPTQSGVYTFVFGILADAKPMTYADNPTSPIFLSENAQKWSGTACLNPTYLAQIPSTGPEQFYLCPAAK